MHYDHFEPGALWLDDKGIHINAHGGGVLFHEGVYYWFGQHMIDGEAGNISHVGVHVYASKDLYNWSDEGIALVVEKDPTHDIHIECAIERPKVIFNARTGKFVMWFHLEREGAKLPLYRDARSGVAIADSPTGPYRYVHCFRPNKGAWPKNMPEDRRHPLDEKEQARLTTTAFHGGAIPPEFEPIGDLLCRRDFATGQMARDMSLFLDDDGTAYHLYSSEENSTLHISRLTDDFLTSSGDYVRLFPGRFHEAPSLMKRRGHYYLFSSACTGWDPNPARLSVADSIFGPWKELGNPCVGDKEAIDITFGSQAAYIFPVQHLNGGFIFMGDQWSPKNAIDGRHIWLPIHFREDGTPFLEWREKWTLDELPR